MSAPEICGYDGYAGKDSEGHPLRLYSAEACKAKGGNPLGNNECGYPQGGSISWDCREVNNNPIAMVYENRYYIGGVVVVGGLLAWRYSMMRS